MRQIIITIILLSFSVPAWSATRYVRTDGGVGTRCTGLADAPDPGSGTDQACAMNHPNWVLPPAGSATPVSTARQATANDIVVIKSGSYRMGIPNATTGIDATINITCPTGDTSNCISGAIPNGVTVIGCSTTGCGCTTGWGGAVTCTTTRPELWGAGNIQGVLNATNSVSPIIQDIEITDHASQGYAYSGATGTFSETCGSNSNQNSLCAYVGLLAHNASSMLVKNVWIHGTGKQGLFAASLSNPTFSGFKNEYNAEIGINNDTTGSCSTCGWTGTITFDKSSVSWTGCVENWQVDGQIISGGCYGTEYGGYGDGFGLARTSGNWVITDSDVSHNVSDGLDLLYHNRSPYSGGTISIKRSRFEGNAGNQIKTSNAVVAEDNMIIGNCIYFLNQSISLVVATDNCRGQGAPVSISFKDSTVPEFWSNTITSNGDVMFNVVGDSCPSPNPQVRVRNNILIGGRDAQQDTSIGFSAGSNDWTDIYYEECATTPTFTNNYCVGMFKDTNECVATNTVVSVANQNNMNFASTILQGGTTANGSTGTGLSAYATYSTEPTNYSTNLYLQISSPAVDGASSSYGDSVDFNNFSRTLPWDVGAVEYGSVPSEGGGGGSSSATTHSQITGRSSISGGFSLP